jgi:hypothetical protein
VSSKYNSNYCYLCLIVASLCYVFGDRIGFESHRWLFFLNNFSVVFDFEGKWYYANEFCDREKFWECYFQPISGCSLSDIRSSAIHGLWDPWNEHRTDIKTVILRFRLSGEFSENSHLFQ